jgi:hypothetical protein
LQYFCNHSYRCACCPCRVRGTLTKYHVPAPTLRQLATCHARDFYTKLPLNSHAFQYSANTPLCSPGPHIPLMYYERGYRVSFSAVSLLLQASSFLCFLWDRSTNSRSRSLTPDNTKNTCAGLAKLSLFREFQWCEI